MEAVKTVVNMMFHSHQFLRTIKQRSTLVS